MSVEREGPTPVSVTGTLVSALANVASGVKVTLGAKADVEKEEPLRGSWDDVGKIWAAVGWAERRRVARRARVARKRRSMTKRGGGYVGAGPGYRRGGYESTIRGSGGEHAEALPSGLSEVLTSK